MFIICIVKLNVMRRGYTLFFRLNFHPDNIMSMNQEKCDDGFHTKSWRSQHTSL